MTRPEFAAHSPSDDRGNDDWHGLKEHLEAVATSAEQLTGKLQADKLGYYAGLWHDLGKYNPKFQVFLDKAHTAKLAGQKEPREKVPHAIYGAILANDLKLTPLSFLIAGHHAGLPNQNDLKSRLATRGDYEIIKAGFEQELGQSKPSEELRAYFKPLGGDKIAADLFLRLIFSCLIDADRLDTEQFANPEQYRLRQERANSVTIAQLWEVFRQKQQVFVNGAKDPTSTVNQVRAEVYDYCVKAAESGDRIFRLAVPTGGGKTRSGLAFALKHAAIQDKDRVIFAVPYTSIIEQTVRVYREEIFPDLADAVLEHHSGTQNEQDGLSQQKEDDLESDENVRLTQEQTKLATQNWDAKLIVTTTVQLFESLLSNKTKRCRKLHNIVNSVIVLDEVQTLPIGFLSPILTVLKELVDRYNVTVVFCTATQPALEGNTPYFRDAFPPGAVHDIIPEKEAIRHFQTLKRVNYEIPQPGQTWTWQELIQDMQSAQSALVVLNTRPDAIAVLNTLDVPNGYNTQPIEPRVLQSLAESEVLHLSTLLCGKHRDLVLREVRRRLEVGEPCSLISTQVVEAGVDLDFPLVYRAMGPLDRIVQAAGRCNRNGKLASGRVVIFEPAAGKQPPKGEYSKAIQKARQLLQADDFSEAMLHQPDLFRSYFEGLYSMIANTDGDLDDLGIQEMRKAWCFRDVGEKFRFIKDDTVPIVIQYDDAVVGRLAAIEQRGIWSGDRAFLQPYIVNIRKPIFDKLTDKQEVKAGLDLWKWTGNYDPIRGFPLDKADQDVVIDPMFLMM